MERQEQVNYSLGAFDIRLLRLTLHTIESI